MQTNDARLSDARTPTAGSANYIQNQSAATQTPAGFSISGTGGANIFNATTQYNIGDSRVLSIGGSSNLFVGDLAGIANNYGQLRQLVCRHVRGSIQHEGRQQLVCRRGQQATKQHDGRQKTRLSAAGAGVYNTTGSSNSFVGSSAGLFNTSGSDNSFVGKSAGESNTTGFSGSFVGTNAGFANTTGIATTRLSARARAQINTAGSNITAHRCKVPMSAAA